MRTLVVALASALLAAGPAGAMPRTDAALLAFVRAYLQRPGITVDDQLPTRAIIAWTDLNGDRRPEALVYVAGRTWCGTGGCDLLILEQRGASFRIRGRLSVARTPIGVLPSRTKGWRDLSVWVQGGGIQPGYTAVAPFSGARYASNPTVAPAYRLKTGRTPTTLITSRDEGVLLFD